MKNRIVYLIALLAMCIAGNTIAQKATPSTITHALKGTTDSGTVKLIVVNHSPRTYYYTITLSGFINGVWTPVLSDINSLGVNEFTALKPIRSKGKVIAVVSLKRIRYFYAFHKMASTRFGVMYRKRKDFESGGGITYTDSM